MSKISIDRFLERVHSLFCKAHSERTLERGIKNMTCILCNESALSGRKYCAVHQVQANSQSLEQKLAAQREALNRLQVEIMMA